MSIRRHQLVGTALHGSNLAAICIDFDTDSHAVMTDKLQFRFARKYRNKKRHPRGWRLKCHALLIKAYLKLYEALT